jgi:hypothetical protein
MNIFILDTDTKKCAKDHVDRHVTKMCVEYAQLLCSAHWCTESKLDIPYKLSHKNHPCSIWTRDCIENYLWLCGLGMDLCEEYTNRYGKKHKSQLVIEWCLLNPPNLVTNGDLTPQPKAMPDEYKVDDVVESYRNYYRGGKKNILVWKNGHKPEWL